MQPSILRVNRIKNMISEGETGFEAWEILVDTYASNDISNIIRMEELFGRVEGMEQQAMEQWIAHVRSLACQLRGVEVIVERVVNHSLNGWGRNIKE